MRSGQLRFETGSQEAAVRGRAPETQICLSRYSASIKLCDSYCRFRLTSVDNSVQRWLGTIDVDMKVVVTPKSGVSVDGEEVGGVGEGWWRQHECPVC